VLYVYAFVAHPARLPPVRGIDGADVRAEPLGELEAVVSDHESAVDVSEDAVLAHARVVEAVADVNAAVLPARFGGMHADVGGLRDFATGRPLLAEALERVSGCVELAVRVAVHAGELPQPSSGGEYMRARLEQRRETERLAEAVHAPLAAFARDAASTVGATPHLLLTGAYLVGRDRVGDFRSAVEALQSRHPELGIVCTGPWPPYTFATAERGRS
jgi:hypothetical protein